mmetsp:Transcript_10559/g.19447  ORF Transcript_10559/g.19447 Transcript_10559/m.19447 type:complete len:207 (+) Transcript_10559:833-1453(+)
MGAVGSAAAAVGASAGFLRSAAARRKPDFNAPKPVTTSGKPSLVATGALGAGAAVGADDSAAELEDTSPTAIFTRGTPTSTVSSTLTRCSLTVPASAALTSTVTLSVSMTTSTSPLATGSPGFFFHSMIVPSVMLSAPNSGTFCSNRSPGLLANRLACCGSLPGPGRPSAKASEPPCWESWTTATGDKNGLEELTRRTAVGMQEDS